MTWRAVNIEPFLAALEHFDRDRERQLVVLFAIAVRALRHAGIEVGVFLQLPARNRVDDLRSRAAMIREYVGSALRDDLRLVVHVLAAAGNENHRRKSEKRCESPRLPRSQNRDLGHPHLFPVPYSLFPVSHQYSTSVTETGSRLSRYALVCAMLNFGSSASRQRKNLSTSAPLRKLGALNSGWYSVGMWLSANMPNAAERPA